MTEPVRRRTAFPIRILSLVLFGALALGAAVTAAGLGAFSSPEPGLEELPSAPQRDSAALRAIVAPAAENRSDALIFVKDNKLLYRGGQTTAKINTHSVRKSIVAVLYGMAVEKGLLSLDESLASMGYDDLESPLSAVEKTATIRDLLTSRSGIYIDASGQNWDRPERHAAKPGEVFFYNNWGFNSLGAILERKAGMPLGEIIAKWLAEPLGMQHFTPDDVKYDSINGSSVEQYVIYMSADDLMRFGLLVANDGRHDGKQLLSPDWIRQMTSATSSAHTDPEPFGRNYYDGYGFLWWTRTQNDRALWCADGWGGQYIVIDKEAGLVMVNRRNTGTNLLAQGWFLWRGQETRRHAMFEIFEDVRQNF